MRKQTDTTRFFVATGDPKSSIFLAHRLREYLGVCSRFANMGAMRAGLSAAALIYL
jgi:hypothetical protein